MNTARRGDQDQSEDVMMATSTAKKPQGTRRKRSKRIVGVDAARGLALVGMMSIHVLPSTTDDGGPTLVWRLAAGVSAALFAFLAGVSLSLSTGGSSPQRGRELSGSRVGTAVRAGILLLLGMLLAVFDPPAGIILSYYGVMFLLAIPLLGAGVKTLMALAVGFAVIGSTIVNLTAGDAPSLDGYDPSFASLMNDGGATLSTLFITGTYPALNWMAFICAGLAIGRLNLRLRDTQLRLVLGGLITVAVSWAASIVVLQTFNGFDRILQSTRGLSAGDLDLALVQGVDEINVHISSPWWLFALSPYSETPIETLDLMGWAVAVFGGMLLLGTAVPWLVRPLVLLGTMTLTLYSLHLIFLSTYLLESVPYLSFWLQVGVSLLFVVLWRNISEWSQGPLEWVVARAASGARSRFMAIPAAK
ncbi:heparan-alpha-glucosaminide N-acetyltransferase domain-containing protein [Citricoccus sp.]|uniref:heparan-alpha-glucosaminide N-acetyltransferase domain-containing protein n=1 Tax=Citricoccus sp. TaxID=1978372 RepID=UPI0028BD91C6|nr:heparan-alpha-glucosaminide N-acetyltransferase domain-containing protein [Citricoccus sp.]